MLWAWDLPWHFTDAQASLPCISKVGGVHGLLGLLPSNLRTAPGRQGSWKYFTEMHECCATQQWTQLVCACGRYGSGSKFTHSSLAATLFNSVMICRLVFLSTSRVTFCPSPATCGVPRVNTSTRMPRSPPPCYTHTSCTRQGWHSPKKTLTSGVGLTFLKVRNCTLGFLYWSWGTLPATKCLHTRTPTELQVLQDR